MRLAKPRPELRIETERLVLRPLTEQDLGDLVAEINDYDIVRMTSLIPHPYGEADARAYFTQTAARARAKDAVRLMIEHGGKLIGGALGQGLRHRSGPGAIGIWLRVSEPQPRPLPGGLRQSGIGASAAQTRLPPDWLRRRPLACARG
jgi:RimJ/RimL family protein N-acetyltransferase